MVGLYFSAAFDRVNHKAPLCKLRQLGVGGPFLSVRGEISYLLRFYFCLLAPRYP